MTLKSWLNFKYWFGVIFKKNLISDLSLKIVGSTTIFFTFKIKKILFFTINSNQFLQNI